MNYSASIRLRKELMEIKRNPPPFCSATPFDESDLSLWIGTIHGLDDTPYQGGVFFVRISIPNDYLFSPPIITFANKIFHPNINPETGEISINILQNEYTPALTISTIMISLTSFLDDPHPHQALMPETARIYLADRELFNKIAKHWTHRYAM